jgi:hypothetical protein
MILCELNNLITLSSLYGKESPLYNLRIVLLSMEIKVLPVNVVVLVANILLFIQIMFVVVNRSTKHEQMIASMLVYKLTWSVL